MSNNSTITCPNCKHDFPIENALSQKIEDDIKARYLKRYNEDKQKFEAEKAQLAKETELIKAQGENQEQILADKLRLAKSQLEQEAIKKAASEMALQMEMLNKELTVNNVFIINEKTINDRPTKICKKLFPRGNYFYAFSCND